MADLSMAACMGLEIQHQQSDYSPLSSTGVIGASAAGAGVGTGAGVGRIG